MAENLPGDPIILQDFSLSTKKMPIYFSFFHENLFWELIKAFLLNNVFMEKLEN